MSFCWSTFWWLTFCCRPPGCSAVSTPRFPAWCAPAALLILFAPELSYPAQILYKILTACAVVGVAFGLQGLRRFVTAVCWYAALNILLAGLCIAVILRTGTPLLQTANLTVYLRISPVVLLLLSAASCGAVWLVLHFSGSTPQITRTIGIEFELCGAPCGCAPHWILGAT